VAGLELSRPASPRVKPQPLPTRDLPGAVWGDHLLPALWCKDVGRLACTSKALEGSMREHFRGDLGILMVKELRPALTTLPRARKLMLKDGRSEWAAGEREELLQWLLEEGRGRHLVIVELLGELCQDLIHTALQQGAFPSLKGVDIRLKTEVSRTSLTGGFLDAMHQLCLTIDGSGRDIGLEPALRPHLAALGLVRELPVLTKLDVELCVGGNDDDDPVQWPPFLPPSLKTLRIQLFCDTRPAIESLLRALPGMLEASGARLERLDVRIWPYFGPLGDGMVHLAQALHCCSPTLKVLVFKTFISDPDWVRDVAGDYLENVERLRVQWEDVLTSVSACRELRVLVLPDIMVETLFPPGTAFPRLTHLEIWDRERARPPDAGMVGLWELMASGGLPEMSELSVRLGGRLGGAEEVRSWIAPALEAVADTLVHLHLYKDAQDEWLSDELDVGYELGVAVGKLQRLKSLCPQLSRDGRFYHAFAQGLAASGGDRPLPLLWRLGLESQVERHADLLASLLLPSVRILSSWQSTDKAAILVACALRQAGNKHSRALRSSFSKDALRVIAQCRVSYISLDEWLSMIEWPDLQF
jgi:hypothetical protein